MFHNFVILSFIIGFSLISIYLLLSQVMLSPLNELKILFVAILFIIFQYSISVVAIYLAKPENLDFVISLYKSQFILRYTAIILISFVWYLPRFSHRYWDVAFMVTFTIAYTLTGATIIETVDINLINNVPIVTMSPITIPFRILTGSLVAYILYTRFVQIDKILKVSEVKHRNLKKDFLVLLFLIVIIVLLNSNVVVTPTLFNLILFTTSLGILYFSYIIFKDRYLLFITDFKIEGVAIANHKDDTLKIIHGSDRVQAQITKFIDKELEAANQLVGQVVESGKEIEFISFGTQEMSISNIDSFSLIIISSNPNLIGNQLVKAIILGLKQFSSSNFNSENEQIVMNLEKLTKEALNYAPLSLIEN